MFCCGNESYFIISADSCVITCNVILWGNSNSSTASFGLNLDQFIVFEQSLKTAFEQVAPDQENNSFMD